MQQMKNVYQIVLRARTNGFGNGDYFMETLQISSIIEKDEEFYDL